MKLVPPQFTDETYNRWKIDSRSSKEGKNGNLKVKCCCCVCGKHVWINLSSLLYGKMKPCSKCFDRERRERTTHNRIRFYRRPERASRIGA